MVMMKRKIKPSQGNRRRGSLGCRQDPCSMESHRLPQRHTEMKQIRFDISQNWYVWSKIELSRRVLYWFFQKKKRAVFWKHNGFNFKKEKFKILVICPMMSIGIGQVLNKLLKNLSRTPVLGQGCWKIWPSQTYFSYSINIDLNRKLKASLNNTS